MFLEKNVIFKTVTYTEKGQNIKISIFTILRNLIQCYPTLYKIN
jgi:hypothetical protein